ncbi:hypothetical protein ABN028_35195, partial [Actinopolymorpha sp. B17G11]|uniref:hypothetical protein n=1 Tax=Actinopolymorpha sp. B17G11 TaxID=3160861 RepID=UPI0032E43A7B
MIEPQGDDPRGRLIEQRVRNRIIEYFELAGSFAAQRDYERAAPIAHVPYEVINQWEDQLPRGPDSVDDWPDVYTADEIEAIKKFHVVWQETAGVVPDDYPSLRDVQAMPAWERLRCEAETAMGVFT